MTAKRLVFLVTLSVVALHISSPAVQAQLTENILFLGDSFTDYVPAANYVPSEVAQDAYSAGYAYPNVSFNTPGGEGIYGQLNDTNALSLIAQGGWNYMVVQDQSSDPAADAAYWLSYHTMDYGNFGVMGLTPFNSQLASLYSLLKAHSPNATMVLYDTWAYSQTYLTSLNNGYYSTPAQMQTLTDYAYNEGLNYLKSIGDTNVLLAPVGDAWLLNNSEQNQNLFWTDNYHPNNAGSYLSSLVLYETIYKTSPVGLSYTYVSGSDTAYLQSLAAQVMPVPEPSTGMLVLSGSLVLIAMLGMRRSGILAKLR